MWVGIPGIEWARGGGKCCGRSQSVDWTKGGGQDGEWWLIGVGARLSVRPCARMYLHRLWCMYQGFLLIYSLIACDPTRSRQIHTFPFPVHLYVQTYVPSVSKGWEGESEYINGKSVRLKAKTPFHDPLTLFNIQFSGQHYLLVILWMQAGRRRIWRGQRVSILSRTIEKGA